MVYNKAFQSAMIKAWNLNFFCKGENLVEFVATNLPSNVGTEMLVYNKAFQSAMIMALNWDFIFERARPFSFFKGQFHWKISKSVVDV